MRSEKVDQDQAIGEQVALDPLHLEEEETGDGAQGSAHGNEATAPASGGDPGVGLGRPRLGVAASTISSSGHARDNSSRRMSCQTSRSRAAAGQREFASWPAPWPIGPTRSLLYVNPPRCLLLSPLGLERVRMVG